MTHKPLAVGVGAGYGEKAPCEGVAEKGVEASNFRAFLGPGEVGGRLVTAYSFPLLPAKVKKSARNFETSKPFAPSHRLCDFGTKKRERENWLKGVGRSKQDG